MKKLILTAALSFISVGSLAENYQTELSAGYLDLDVVDGFVLGATYHFNEVDTSGKPLAEAAFLSQSSNVSLSYTDIEDFDATAIAAEFYIGKFYFAPSYVDPSFGDSQFAAALGYAAENWRVTTTVPEEDYELNVDFKYVAELAGGNFLNFEAAYADGGDILDDSIFVAADYYFDETFSLGAVFVDFDGTDFGVRANKFFTSKFSAGATFLAGENVDTFTLDLALRF